MRRETPMNFPPLHPSVASSPVPRSVKSRPLSSPLLICSRRFHFFLSVRLLKSHCQKPLSELGLVLVCAFCPQFWCHSLYIGHVSASNLECLKAFVFVPVFSVQSSSIGPINIGGKHVIKDYESCLCIRIFRICCDSSVNDLVRLWGLLRN